MASVEAKSISYNSGTYIFTYPIHDLYEVSVSKNAITSELEALNKKK